MKKNKPKIKTLILTVQIGNQHDWQIRALQMQINDYFKANCTILPTENVIIMPTKGETRLYWLEGDPEDIKDAKTIEDIIHRVKPVLSVALGIEADPNRVVKHPKIREQNPKLLKRSIEELKRRRDQTQNP